MEVVGGGAWGAARGFYSAPQQLKALAIGHRFLGQGVPEAVAGAPGRGAWTSTHGCARWWLSRP